MSKAFTKEDQETTDNEADHDTLGVPLGSKNYMTPGCAKRLQAELKNLRYKERPEVTRVVSWAAGNGDRSENGDYLYNKKRLREIDKRMRYLSKRLQNAEVIDPLGVKADHVLFGATVTIRDENEVEKIYRIVGVDEVDISKRKISWVSPLGSALLKARAGDLVTFNSPKGPQEIEIISVQYLEIEA